MANYQIFLFIGGILAAYACLYYVDNRFGWRCIDWLNGIADNPFERSMGGKGGDYRYQTARKASTTDTLNTSSVSSENASAANSKGFNAGNRMEEPHADSHILVTQTEWTGLQERIQTLEKIVTEPAYELNKKINALR